MQSSTLMKQKLRGVGYAQSFIERSTIAKKSVPATEAVLSAPPEVTLR
jgi:hypothetical protein